MFLCTIISLYFLAYVFSRMFRYFWTTSLSNEVTWSYSSPIVWSKKCSDMLGNTDRPSALRTVYWIWSSMFFSKLIPVLVMRTIFLNNCSVNLTILKTSIEGKISPPHCFINVNFAYCGNCNWLLACGSFGSRSKADLHETHFNFWSICRTTNPQM